MIFKTDFDAGFEKIGNLDLHLQIVRPQYCARFFKIKSLETKFNWYAGGCKIVIKIPKTDSIVIIYYENPLAKARTSEFRYLDIEISVYNYTNTKYTACDLRLLMVPCANGS